MRKITRSTFLVTFALLVLATTSYLAFVAFFFDYIESKAALLFIQSHRALGESEGFILDTAGNGLPQPWEIVITWQPFQIGTVIALVMIAGLAWLTYTNWKLSSPS